MECVWYRWNEWLQSSSEILITIVPPIFSTRLLGFLSLAIFVSCMNRVNAPVSQVFGDPDD